MFPREGNSLLSNRIPYTELCNYIITQELPKGGVYFHCENIEYEICGSSLMFRNVVGAEIQHILESIQSELCRENITAKETMDSTVAWAFGLARTEMATGFLEKRTKAILTALMLKPDYCDEAASLLAENLFRLCNVSEYKDFLKVFRAVYQQKREER